MPGRHPGGRPRRREASLVGPSLAYFEALLAAYGPQRWWPARTPFEVVVGAILTQGVAWRNVEAAIGALSREGLLDPERMAGVPRARLARLLRPAGYYNQKARTLAAFLRHLREAHGGDLGRCLRQPLRRLRVELLEIRGIGPETADAIVLYAAGLPSFVVDAYTVRVLRRHGLLRGDEAYEEAQRAIAADLPLDARIYNEFHALLVRVAKDRCLKAGPRCAGCPLESHLPPGGPEPDPAGPPRRLRRAGYPSGRSAARHRAD
jgi:endonuclease-3 related protein